MTKEQKTYDNSEEKVKELLNEIKKLKEENEKLKSRKKYGIVWEEEKEPEKVVLECKEKLPILKDVKDKEILTDKNKPMNILIEGDNYHALQVLNYTHKGKIDVIYIDPPYNTGNSNFLYNDRYVDLEDTYRHSKWLNFMSKRLRLAKELLNMHGVIFISIDDNEVSQLRSLCDEIFDENNRLDRGVIIWNNAGSTKGFRSIVKNHEYILAYAKDFKNVRNYFGENFPDELGLVEGRLQIKRTKRNPICRLNFPKGTPIEGVKNVKFENSVGATTNRIDIINGPMEFKDGRLTKDIILEASFPYRFQVEKYFKNINTGKKTYDTKGQEIISIFFQKNGVPYYRKRRNIQVMGSVQSDLPNSGLRDLQKILPGIEFSNPKPVELIVRLLSYFSPKNGIILDFMEGSGTTGHSVLEINKRDKGKRKFILVNKNEKKIESDKEIKICTDICYPRIKKVILNLEEEANGKLIKNMPGNLKYFKTDFIDVGNIYDVSDEKKIELTYKAGEMIALREDAFEEIEKNKWWQIFKNKNKTVAIYFREDQSKLGDLFEKLKKGNAIVYLFSWGKNEVKGQEHGYDNITIKDIPQPIIEVYKEVNRL
ncbi:MAG: hypothetical protein A7316_09020 [Candidatus Altiarchaeales archaeon WOR_SM1_86-2]|nr:MAG: hypothetical protein A7316_09020 [Candidatus Altiarchaeales archaeon WOR_SM1_86-2]ODS39903.1 MAG: hypothetical protein A7315_10170 [Candidatus Altiarchaeales archaeon WOR_SM1_79]